MDLNLSLCGLMLLHLIMLLGPSNGAHESKNTANEIENHHHHHSHADIRIEQVHSHTSSHMHHIDPSIIVFFLIDDLKLGSTIPIFFPNRKLSDSLPHSLSKNVASSIPFTSREFKNLVKRFSFSEGSPQALAMQETLRECERKPIRGETKICATSFESMLDFTRKIFGPEARSESLSTTHVTRSSDRDALQKYTVMGIHEIPAPKSVACHTMPYPYAVFYCHYQESESKVFKVLLSGENGDEVEAVAVCHMDTSQWGPNHVAFKVLGVGPGSEPVCHFFPADNLVWVPSAIAN